MQIWILNHYAGNMLFDEGGRHYYFAKYLRREGHSPTIFCSNAKHNSNAEVFYHDDGIWNIHQSLKINVPFVYVKSRPYSNNGKTRVINILQFYWNVKKAAKEYARINGKPSIIYASSVHPLTLVAGIQLAKKYQVKCICEVRDLWPQSLVDYGIVKENSLIVYLLRKFEKWIYVHAQSLIFTMEGGYEYIRDQGWEDVICRDKVHYINNGVDLEDYDYNRQNCVIHDSDLDDETIHRVIYAGSIRKANNSIMILPDVAEELVKRKREDICILVYGKGDYAEKLVSDCKKRGIKNLVYKGFVKKQEVPYLLSKSEVNILNCSSAEVDKYGTSRNKLFEYLASGQPILSGENDRYSIIKNRECGISEHFKSASEIADAIITLVENHKEYTNVRKVGEEYAFSKLTKQLLKIMGV